MVEIKCEICDSSIKAKTQCYLSAGVSSPQVRLLYPVLCWVLTTVWPILFGPPFYTVSVWWMSVPWNWLKKQKVTFRYWVASFSTEPLSSCVCKCYFLLKTSSLWNDGIRSCLDKLASGVVSHLDVTQECWNLWRTNLPGELLHHHSSLHFTLHILCIIYFSVLFFTNDLYCCTETPTHDKRPGLSQ